MKNKYYLKKMFIIFASLLLLMHISSCSDDYLLHRNNHTGGGSDNDGGNADNGNNNGNNNGDANNGDSSDDEISGSDENDNTKPPTHTDLLDSLQDANKGIKTHEISKAQLSKIDPSLSNLKAKVYVRAYKGRSKEKTKPVIVIAQSLFGTSIKKQIADYTDKLQSNEKAKNSFFIFIDSIETLPDTTKFKIKSLLVDKSVAIKNYKSLKDQSEDIFGGHIGNMADLGSIYYDNKQIDIYDETYKVVASVSKLLEQGDKWKFNSNEAAIVSFDPFMSSVAVDLAAANNSTPFINAKFTKVAATTPIMAFGQGKAYPSGLLGFKDEDKIDSTYANIGYKIKLLDIIGNVDASAKGKLLYNVLRVGGSKDKNLFSSLAGGGTTHDLITKYASKKIDKIKFYFITGDDHAKEDGIKNIKGHKLVLDDNVNSDKVGMNAIVNNKSDITNSDIELSDADYNFPANDADAAKYIENTSVKQGLIKYIVENN